jgi:hypothetical protein
VQQARPIHRTSCVLLPDDHGIVFARGYYLQSGACKVFDSDLQDMLFEQCLASPNGEDFLYVFYNRDTGVYILLPYNLIDQQLATPIVCHGYALFAQGDLILCKASATPQKHHAVQIWQSPFVGSDMALVPTQRADSYLSKIGSRELVQGMAECQEILTLLRRDEHLRQSLCRPRQGHGRSYRCLFLVRTRRVGNLKEGAGSHSRQRRHSGERVRQSRAGAAEHQEPG